MTAVDYAEFVAKVYACQHAELPSDTMSNHKWLDDYREIGEVKQELKKRESQYIVYKDIMYVHKCYIFKLCITYVFQLLSVFTVPHGT